MYSIIMHSTDASGAFREEVCSVMSTSPRGLLLANRSNVWWTDWVNLELHGVDLLLDGKPVPDEDFQDYIWMCKRGGRKQ